MAKLKTMKLSSRDHQVIEEVLKAYRNASKVAALSSKHIVASWDVEGLLTRYAIERQQEEEAQKAN